MQNVYVLVAVLCVKMDESELELPLFEPDSEKLRSLTVRLQETFGLDLFGIEVIIENGSGRYAVIDGNTFPRLTRQRSAY